MESENYRIAESHSNRTLQVNAKTIKHQITDEAL